MGTAKLYDLDGEMLTVKQLYARKTVMMHIDLLYERLRNGMSPKDAISKPLSTQAQTASRVARTTPFNRRRYAK